MATIHQIGPFRHDAETGIVFRNAEPLALGQRAVALLRVLVERAGAPVSKAALMDAAWSGLAVEESNLTAQIAALRRVFREEPGGERWIETLPRRGYRFVGPLVATRNPPQEKGTEVKPALLIPDGPSLAVLPFVNMSGDPEQEYFSDGITEDIITDLSKVSTLNVLSRNTTFTFKGKAVEIGQLAQRLKVGYVVEGSVRKAGGRVRITAQLIDASKDSHVWGERYDRELKDIFALQDEIAQAIVAALKVKLLPAERRRSRVARRKTRRLISSISRVGITGRSRERETWRSLFGFAGERWKSTLTTLAPGLWSPSARRACISGEGQRSQAYQPPKRRSRSIQLWPRLILPRGGHWLRWGASMRRWRRRRNRYAWNRTRLRCGLTLA